MSDENITKRIQDIIEALNDGIEEKEEVVAVSLLAALAGQNTFLLGPPGTAKSLISRRLASVFKTKGKKPHFEYLLNRFSAPEELFGPIDIKQLKKGKYVRKTEGYLPKAEFAFLDEIWKAGPAVLNTLLTIINEKKFHNGGKVQNVPLKALISASNETPPLGQGLEALYDRFLVRLVVSPIQEQYHFNKMIEYSSGEMEKVKIENKITDENFCEWHKGISEIDLSDNTKNVIQMIKDKVNTHNGFVEEANKSIDKKEEKIPVVYISDRRWKRAAHLLKAAAYFCGRRETNLVDDLLLKHCLWSNAQPNARLNKSLETAGASNMRLNESEKEILTKIVLEAVEANSHALNNEEFVDEEIKEMKNFKDNYARQQKSTTIGIGLMEAFVSKTTKLKKEIEDELGELDKYHPFVPDGEEREIPIKKVKKKLDEIQKIEGEMQDMIAGRNSPKRGA